MAEKLHELYKENPVKGKRWPVRVWRQQLWSGLERISILLILVFIWELLPRMEWIDPFLLPAFSDVLKALGEIIRSGEMTEHIMVSFNRSFTGFVLAVSFSIPLGILMGRYKRIERIVNPLLEICRTTPTLALYPVFILFFGLGEVSKVAVIIWGTIWPTLLNTISGVKHIDPLLIKSARSMGISSGMLLCKVVLPDAAPFILTGLRLSVTVSILILVAAEMLNARSGLGFMIFYYEGKYFVPEMYSGILTISMLGLLLNYILIKLENSLMKWKPR